LHGNHIFIADYKPGYAYHVTSTDLVTKIKKVGLKPMQTSNWQMGGTGQRYGQGQIYAFDHLMDAIRWAARMDWDKSGTYGSGNISILKFKKGGGTWEEDPGMHDPTITPVGAWLRRMGGVPAKDIVGHKVFDTKLLKVLQKQSPLPDW